MQHIYEDIESIIGAGTSGRLNHDAVYAFAHRQNLAFDDVCNAVALTIAKRFNDFSMSYEDADGVANALSDLMISHIQRDTEVAFPEPAWTIYLASDAGEYYRE